MGEAWAHVAIGVLKRNTWPIQTREFKEECLRSLEKVQRSVSFLRSRNIVRLATMGSWPSPLGLKEQMEGAVLGEPKENENIGEGWLEELRAMWSLICQTAGREQEKGQENWSLSAPGLPSHWPDWKSGSKDSGSKSAQKTAS